MILVTYYEEYVGKPENNSNIVAAKVTILWDPDDSDLWSEGGEPYPVQSFIWILIKYLYLKNLGLDWFCDETCFIHAYSTSY